jgi:hypothetical protein
MTAQDAPAGRGDQEHPSPHRGNVSLAALWSGLLLAPSAWFLQLAIDTPVLSQACYPRDEPYRGVVPHLSELVMVVDALTLAACIGSFLLAWRNWRRTAREKPGKGARLMGSGDGRSRFMAMSGMLASGLVATAVLYIGIAHLLLRECGS